MSMGNLAAMAEAAEADEDAAADGGGVAVDGGLQRRKGAAQHNADM